MKVDRIALVRLRNGFYKDGFRRMTFVLLLSLIVNLILIIALLITRNRIAPPVYFAANADGVLVKLKPIINPVYNNKQISDWVTRAVPNILQINFMQFRNQMQSSKNYFTSFGWGQFIKSFQPQLDQIINQKLTATGVTAGVPVVTEQLLLKGAYSWYVEVPVMITFEGASGKATTNRYVWRILLSRVDNRKSNQLLGIQQVIVTPYKGA
jgi:intracellular multiplication protein IcmL